MKNRNPWKAVNRRQTLALIGAAGATSVMAMVSRAWALCALTPAQTEGPYWVDERLNRSDITLDPSDDTVSDGVPLTLNINVLRADAECAAAAGVQVDVWHCDAGGLYSDESANNTVGRKFLRGYQVTDANGAVRFTTIYPGWYNGRTIHIHFRIRTFDGSTTTFNFASQLYFDDLISNQVLSQSPYNGRGTRNTTNTNDNIFSAATLLGLSGDIQSGFVGSFDVALNGLPEGAEMPTATPSPSPSPTAAPISCAGDCDGNGSVTVDDLIKGTNVALGDADLSVCPHIDGDSSGSVTIEELIAAVNDALSGCGVD